MQRIKLQSIFLLISINFCQHAFSQYIPYCQKSKWGFASTDGKITIPCVYEETNFYSDDSLAKVKIGGKYGYINYKGMMVIPFEYDNCNRIYEVYHVEHGIGIKRNPLIHLNSDWNTADLKNNRFIVSKNKKHGVIYLLDGKTKVLIPLIYTKIQYDLDKRIFLCSINSKIQYFNIHGQEFTLEQVNSIEINRYSTIGRDYETRIPVIVKNNGKIGVIVRSQWEKMKYDTLVPVIYDDIITDNFNSDQYSTGNDVFGVKKNNKWGVVDDEKNILLPIQFDTINYQLSKDFRHWQDYQRMFVVCKNNKWGIVGKNKESGDSLITLLPFEFQEVSKMYYSFLLVKKDNKFQIYSIDKHKLK